ncbi:hypothetical protein HPB50_000688 [Hyalomma asiaticum]|uniref:Uncharacterized protein n=1 Tax=Hyalomma asiaticum TaxID=266040 RepID=A0ACB7SHU2_HYAAI|nr:hypothetical protein HPB50_000688 [Hyalomma asiaticum]
MFVIIFFPLTAASSVGFVLILRISFLGFLKFLLWVIFIDCIGMGVLVATALWAISNKYLLKPTCRTEDVEWGYAFDVHLNAFFPPLVVLHVFQLFFSRLLSHHISLLFGNTLWLIALGYYIYITFLGYSEALKRIEKSVLNFTRIISQVANRRNGLQEDNLMKAFHTFLICHIIYAAPFLNWKTEPNEIDKLIRAGLKRALSLP